MYRKIKYSACDHFDPNQRDLPINEEVREAISKNFRVSPIYEKALFDYTFRKTHSLQSNKFLHCRWLKYQSLHLGQKPEPFIFPSANDFHFYNCHTCYKPELSIRARSSYRFELRDGPGVDKYGEIPLPSDRVGSRTTGMMIHDNIKTIVKPKIKTKKLVKRR